MIRRGKHTANFTTVPNGLVNDSQLSAEATGVLLYLLSKPFDWTVQIKHLQKRFSCGRDRVRRILKELEEAGYLVRLLNREEVSGRYSKVDFEVFDKPQSENPSPETENPSRETPPPENPPLTKDRALQKKENTKTADGGHFDDFWKVVPKKVGKGAARVAYAKAIKKTDHVTIGEAMWRYNQQTETKDQSFVVHPARWLNEERWTDEPPRPRRRTLNDIAG